MRTWGDTDEICENTRNVIKMISAWNVNKFSDIRESILLPKECPGEEEYECGWFSDTAFILLKTLLRIRIKLRRTDPRHHLIPVLIQADGGFIRHDAR